uniref:Uncharacterized protein n=1 Tax=Rhodnius prolixus TaxID=13249 RepID=T1HEE7_RHOPR
MSTGTDWTREMTKGNQMENSFNWLLRRRNYKVDDDNDAGHLRNNDHLIMKDYQRRQSVVKRIKILEQCWQNVYDITNNHLPIIKNKMQLMNDVMHALLVGKSYCTCNNCKTIRYSTKDLGNVKTYIYSQMRKKLDKVH